MRTAPFDEGNNIFWQPQGNPRVYWTMSSTSRKINPALGQHGRARLPPRSGQPGDRQGSMVAYNAGFRTDLSGVAVPRGAAPDIGAYER